MPSILADAPSGVLRAVVTPAAMHTPALPVTWPAPGASAYLRCIQALADEFERPFEEIALVYCANLAMLAASASVFDYLPVLVSKRLRSQYARLELPVAAACAGPDHASH